MKIFSRIFLVGICCLSLGFFAFKVYAIPVSLGGEKKWSSAEGEILDQLERDLNAMTSLQTSFKQIGDGQIAFGQLYVRRPAVSGDVSGGIRLSYQRPPSMEIFTHDGYLVLWDKCNHETHTLPLETSPIGLLLQPTIQLRPVTRKLSFEAEGTVHVTIAPEEDDTLNCVTLIFKKSAVRGNEGAFVLKGWIFYDYHTGRENKVEFLETAWNVPILQAIFNKPACFSPDLDNRPQTCRRKDS